MENIFLYEWVDVKGEDKKRYEKFCVCDKIILSP